MGKLDKRQKKYFEDPKRFADAWNTLVFHGMELVRWWELQEANTVMTNTDSAETLEKIPDMVMKRTVEGKLLALLVLENQKAVDYSIAVRVLLEEVMAYEKQVREIKRYNESLREGIEKYGDIGEMLYHFKKKDRIRPVSTLVLYWNDKPWDGANSLEELIDFGGVEEMRELVPKFQLHLMDMSKVMNVSQFQTDLRSMVEYFQRRNDWKRFWEYSRNCEEKYELDEDGILVMGELVSTKRFGMLKEMWTKRQAGKKEIGREKGKMCKAIEDLIEQGIEQGIERGIEQGIEQNTVSSVENVMKNLGLSLSAACMALGVTEDQYRKAKKSVRACPSEP